jgi:hypothetical protein
MTSLYRAPPDPEVQGGEEPERSEVRFPEQTRKHLLVLRLTSFDPEGDIAVRKLVRQRQERPKVPLRSVGEVCHRMRRPRT